MPKFRKLPVEIEAHKIPLAGEPATSILSAFMVASDRKVEWDEGGSVIIETLEGHMRGNPGDWIIKGIRGELYPCKPDIFAATYEPI